MKQAYSVNTDSRPTLRPDIHFSPPNLSGAQEMYYVKDQATNWFYRIGAKEYFLLSRMDGQRSLAEIGAAYAAQFGRRLDEHAWARLFALINQRQMLLETANPEQLAELRETAEQKLRAARRGLLRNRIPLLNPDRLLGKLAPWFGVAFRPAFLIGILIVLLAIQVMVVADLANLLAVAEAHWRDPVVFSIFSLIVLFSVTLHEFAHGLACKYYGGNVREIGILWRYLSFFPYCKLDDALLFKNPYHRVATAGAGFVANVFTLIPFSIIWVLAPADSTIFAVSALILTIYNIIALIDLVPFVELDGYFMLSYALGMADLRKDSHHFWALRLRKALLGQGEGVSAYSPRARRIYAWYGALSIVFTASFFVLNAVFWFRTFRQWFSDPVALGIVGGGLLIILFGPMLWRAWRPRRETARALAS